MVYLALLRGLVREVKGFSFFSSQYRPGIWVVCLALLRRLIREVRGIGFFSLAISPGKLTESSLENKSKTLKTPPEAPPEKLQTANKPVRAWNGKRERLRSVQDRRQIHRASEDFKRWVSVFVFCYSLPSKPKDEHRSL